jgi:hypothetical protein
MLRSVQLRIVVDMKAKTLAGWKKRDDRKDWEGGWDKGPFFFFFICLLLGILVPSAPHRMTYVRRLLVGLCCYRETKHRTQRKGLMFITVYSCRPANYRNNDESLFHLFCFGKSLAFFHDLCCAVNSIAEPQQRTYARSKVNNAQRGTDIK